MIKSSDVSVIIQGPILNEITKKSIESINKYFPDSQIIISTWENEKTNGLFADKIIKSRDPGSLKMTLGKRIRFNNTNRMIISTREGLKIADRKFSVRIRSDMFFNSNKLLRILEQKDFQAPDRYIEKRIIVLQSHHPFRSPAIFAISDWFYAGLTVDLQKLYDLPTQSLETFELSKESGLASWEKNITAEQYIWKSFLIKLKEYSYVNTLTYMKQNDIKLKKLYLKSILDFLIICNPKSVGVDSLKHPGKSYVSNELKSHHLIKEDEFIYLYKKEVLKKIDLKRYIVSRINILIFKSYIIYLRIKS